MPKSKAKIVSTEDAEGKENGWLMELKKNDRFTESYLTVVKPGCFKGYHEHKVRESNYVCIRGTVTVITYTKNGREETVLHPGDKMNIPINTPTGIMNGSDAPYSEAWLVNFPDPPYDPLLTDEQIDYTEEEILKWVEDQNE